MQAVESIVVSLLENALRFILMMTAYRHFRRTKVPSTKAAILAVQLYGIMALGQLVLLF